MEVSATVLTSLSPGQGTALKTNLDYKNHIDHHIHHLCGNKHDTDQPDGDTFRQ